MDELKFTGSTTSSGKLDDVENQAYEYEPFIMWTDDEIHWNLGENLKIEEAEKNMRIQVTEIGNGKRIVVIISSLDSEKVLYKGQSNNYCTTFTNITKEVNIKIPIVSFAIIDGSLVCASSMDNIMETSVPQEEESSEDPEVSIKNVQNRRMFGKVGAMFANALSFYSGESSTSASTQKYEMVHTNEIPSINNDKLTENAMEEVSPETNALLGDKEESTEITIKEESSKTNKQEGEEQITPINEERGDSKEESSEKVKKRRSLVTFAKKVTKSNRQSSGSKLTKVAETSASNAEVSSSQMQDRSTLEGLWHLEQDKNNDKVIRLRPVKHDTGSSYRPSGFVTILENRSKVQCEQIVPFTYKGKSWFLMIYTTHYINDEESKQNRSLCTRYHVFSLETIMGCK
ncbi:uncharacterized protein LOC117112570 [Anneissia japonica]|uniref:uncharacterized protein LOC117112570 n=1 Tax=Anneissia japonica TaxID=1529436 RepID=UPI0014258E71|nr:uncharacterized protein LOC117112570 [Anneissia japonica]